MMTSRETPTETPTESPLGGWFFIFFAFIFMAIMLSRCGGSDDLKNNLVEDLMNKNSEYISEVEGCLNENSQTDKFNKQQVDTLLQIAAAGELEDHKTSLVKIDISIDLTEQWEEANKSARECYNNARRQRVNLAEAVNELWIWLHGNKGRFEDKRQLGEELTITRPGGSLLYGQAALLALKTLTEK